MNNGIIYIEREVSCMHVEIYKYRNVLKYPCVKR
jgi:hypothetical protein